MIFNCVLISLYKKQIYTSFFVIYYCSLNLIWYSILSLFFLHSSFSHFLLFCKYWNLNFEDFHLFVIAQHVAQEFLAFIRNLNMHLYQNNINLKTDIPYSLPLYTYNKNLIIWYHYMILSYIYRYKDYRSKRQQSIWTFPSHSDNLCTEAIYSAFNTQINSSDLHHRKRRLLT